MNDQLPSGGLSQAYVQLVSDSKVQAAEIAILKVQQATMNDLPRLLAIQDLRLAALERSLRSMRGLGWSLLLTFLLFIANQAYTTWLQGKLTPPPVYYPSNPGGPK